MQPAPSRASRAACSPRPRARPGPRVARAVARAAGLFSLGKECIPVREYALIGFLPFGCGVCRSVHHRQQHLHGMGGSRRWRAFPDLPDLFPGRQEQDHIPRADHGSRGGARRRQLLPHRRRGSVSGRRAGRHDRDRAAVRRPTTDAVATTPWRPARSVGVARVTVGARAAPRSAIATSPRTISPTRFCAAWLASQCSRT